MEENIKSTVGLCPHCRADVIFIPTSKKLIFVCTYCNKKVKQFINGKIHWTSVEDYLKTEMD